jgi:5S rRNA maturation endonuclease (ribonuclease M5)
VKDFVAKASEVKPVLKEVYTYTDEQGVPIREVLRYEPKNFKQRAADGSWSVKGLRNVPYRLPEVIEAVAAGRRVLIVEGEKDVETCRFYGFAATCNAGGAGKWDESFTEYFRGADVILVPDNDEPGFKHMSEVSKMLSPVVDSIKYLYLPTGKKDLSAIPFTGLEEFEALINKATTVVVPDNVIVEEPGEPEEELMAWVVSARNSVKPIKWLIENYIEQDAITQVYGPPASGKSFLSISLAASVATGLPWYGNEVDQGVVLYVAGEGHNGIMRRLGAWEVFYKQDLGPGQLLKTHRAISIMDKAEAERLVKQVERMTATVGQHPKLVVIDTVARSFGDGDENSTKDMNMFIEHVDCFIRKRFGCSVLLVHHSGHTEGRARGSSALRAAVDAEYQVSSEEGVVSFKATKMKDAEHPQAMTFKFTGVPLGEVDGELVTSVVLTHDFDELDVVIVKSNAAFEEVKARHILAELRHGWIGTKDLGEILKLSNGAVANAMKRCVALGLVEKQERDYVLSEKSKSLLSLSGLDLLDKSDARKGPPVWKRNQIQKVGDYDA